MVIDLNQSDKIWVKARKNSINTELTIEVKNKMVLDYLLGAETRNTIMPADGFIDLFYQKQPDFIIVKEILNLMECDISVQIIVDDGYLFKIYIPLSLKKERNLHTEQWDIAKNFNWKNKSILVIDDEELNFILTKAILEDTGADFTWAKDGEEGIKSAFETNFDLIITDVRMPVIDGFEVTRSLKQQKPSIPIVIQSAHDWLVDRQKIVDSGCDYYFNKPINAFEFISTLNILINKHNDI